MDKNQQILALGTMFLLLVGIPAIALADNHNMSPSVTVGNEPPVIYYMNLDNTSYDPTESSTTPVTMTIRVRDSNGVATLNNSALKTQVDDTSPFSSAVAKYTNITCTPLSDLSATEREYKCSWDMDYWDTALTYATKVYAGDKSGANVNNDTTTNAPTYTYTTLVATGIDNTGIGFGSVNIGSTNNPATQNPTTLNNTGNADLYINVTGADLISGIYTYAIGNFSVSLDGVPSSEQYLTTSSSKITGAAIAKGTDIAPSPTEDIYWFVDVPTGLQPLTYTGTWTLTQYEQ
jgi:hypothetical protein